MKSLLAFGFAAALGLAAPAALPPLRIAAAGPGFTNALTRTGGCWTDGRVAVTVGEDGRIAVRAPGVPLETVTLSADFAWPDGTRVLGDAWERACGELGWRPVGEGDVFAPWYFLATAQGRSWGCGVEVQPAALAGWRIRRGGLDLVLDVSCGGEAVELADRVLDAVRVVVHRGAAGEGAFAVGRELCRRMCPHPRLPREPVYGYNDWYCAYGRNTATNFLADAEFALSCARGLENRPFVVMDDGWQRNSPPQMARLGEPGASGIGPWDASGAHFGMDMPEFCARIRALGAKPGLWYRPLHAWPELPQDWRVPEDGRFLDPTVPGVRRMIAADLARFRGWGVRLVKVDYLVYDLCRHWTRLHGERLIPRGTATWRDRSRTTAEVVRSLYGELRAAAGDEMVIIGCNAVNHLAAGLFEVQRIGNDVSGWKWDQTRSIGVNALGFRMVQDGLFFSADGDCVGLAEAGAVPWEKNRQWLDLVARSGSALFVSWRRALADDAFRAALARAFAIASRPRASGEPLDWTEGPFPARWRFADGEASYDWR